MTVPDFVRLARSETNLDDDGHLDVLTTVTTETDDTLVLAPDGAGGVEFRAETGGGGSSLTVKDEGTPLTTAATSIDFVGAGVTATGATAAKTVTIPGATRATLGLDTTDSPEFAGVNVGHASDTTITRTGSGEIAVEGNRIFRVGGADVPIADGGTGASTATAAFDALSPMTTQDDLIIGGASGTRTRLGKGSDGQVLMVDPVTHHLVWATPSGGGSLTTKDEGSTLSSGVTALDFVGAGVTASGGGATTTITIPGGSSNGHSYALDQYALDGTYGDDFTAASLSGIWTRRNFTSGNETYQLGENGSFMRVTMTGRAKGDGYFQTAPAGDWTFMVSYIPRYWTAIENPFGIACVNSVGTGLATGFATASGCQLCVLGITTYTTYSGSFQAVPSDSATNAVFSMNDRKTWHKLRKSGTNYFGAYSHNGETWSAETPAFSSAITVDRVGFFIEPQAGLVTTATYDIDIFNKIA